MTDQTWTPWIGLQRVAIRVGLRAPLAIIGWAALLWLAAPVLNFVEVGGFRTAVLVILVMVAPGVAIGHWLSYNLTDAAGMVGLPVAAVAVAGVWLALWAGTEVTLLLRELGEWQVFFSRNPTGVFASLWAMKNTMSEE